MCKNCFDLLLTRLSWPEKHQEEGHWKNYKEGAEKEIVSVLGAESLERSFADPAEDAGPFSWSELVGVTHKIKIIIT